MIAAGAPVHFILVAGPAIDEPVIQRGPFVMADARALTQAMAAYEAGEFAVAPGKRRSRRGPAAAGRASLFRSNGNRILYRGRNENDSVLFKICTARSQYPWRTGSTRPG
ncbi:pirin-like C-terminal cupin domain-containing protein [Achromobacter insuavis]